MTIFDSDTGVRQGSLRASNLALVVRTVCGSARPLSRAEVAAATSMTRATAARLVDDLVAGGVLGELAPGSSSPAAGKRGRPGTPLVAGSRLAAVGLQVNAGFLAVRVLDLRGRVVAESLQYEDLVGSDPGEALARLGELAARVLGELSPELTLVGAGLALPGLVDGTVLLLAPNLGWADVAPLGKLGALGSLPVFMDNEANLAARTVAEVAPGRAGPYRNFVYLSGEIGIGGAAVLDGAVMTGRHGWAGEIGHVCVDPSGPVCRCGSTGCLETFVGRDALLAAAGLTPESTPKELAELAASGDPRAEAALDMAAGALAIALGGALNVLDIPTVVVGGHLAHLADLLRPRVEAKLGERVLSARWTPPHFEAATNPPAPGATGAAYRALSAVLADPARWLD